MIFPEKENRKKAESLIDHLYFGNAKRSFRIFIINYLEEQSEKYDLSKIEIDVLTKTFSEGKTLKQAGIEIDLTPERIRKIEAKAIEKIINNGF